MAILLTPLVHRVSYSYRFFLMKNIKDLDLSIPVGFFIPEYHSDIGETNNKL